MSGAGCSQYRGPESADPTCMPVGGLPYRFVEACKPLRCRSEQGAASLALGRGCRVVQLLFSEAGLCFVRIIHLSHVDGGTVPSCKCALRGEIDHGERNRRTQS